MENQLQTPDVDCPPPDKKRVLVVEDYEDIRTVLHGILQQMGYEVVSCANGTEAIKTFLDDFRCFTDVGLLMDLSLPDINGLRVMSAIREIEKGSTLTCTPIRMGIITAQGHIVEGTDTY